jgi:taurine dioxygenase
MSISTTTLTSSIGAEVQGVDLTAPIDEETAEEIRQALAKYSVLLFRDQALDDEHQARVAEIFGPLEPSQSRKLFGLNDPVRVIERGIFHMRDEGTIPYAPTLGEYKGWHVDDGFCAQIIKAATLRPLTLPAEAGDTCWTSMGAVFESLSPPLQAWLETLDAINRAQPNFRATVGFYDLPKEIQRKFDEELAVRRHPVVVRHPVTGRKILFVNPVYTAAIDGLNDRESASLLRFLFSESVRPATVYRHHWRMGDLIIWDELATLHIGPETFAPERQLVRIYGGVTTPTAARASAPPPREAVPA